MNKLVVHLTDSEVCQLYEVIKNEWIPQDLPDALNAARKIEKYIYDKKQNELAKRDTSTT